MDIYLIPQKSAADYAVQQLFRSPRLPQLVRRFEDVLRDERKKRERFYEQMSEQQKTEFINGEVIVQSPAKLRHIIASESLFELMSFYVKLHDLGFVGYEKLLVTLTRNDYEPDICFFRQAKAQSFTPDQMKFPAPDVVVEILSPTTEDNDRGIKFEDYALHGVAEYWLVDPEEEFVEQYVLKGESYEMRVKARSGVIQSTTIEGFEIPVRAIFDREEQFAVLKSILTT